jgi:2-dehydro-3-deoxyphosphogluconate aldolase/(4S)-4-hydroxy-2-oxoglutarate aldolase
MFIRALKEKMPHVEMIAVGGVTPDSIPEFLRAGATAAIAGSSLLDPKWISAGNWNAITERAKAFVRGAAAFEPATRDSHST